MNAIAAVIDAKFLTVARLLRGACASCSGFRRARTATFHVLLRPQVTKFSFLKSAPNRLNYMDIRRLFVHGCCRLPDKDISRKCLVLLSNAKTGRLGPSGSLGEWLDFLAKML